MKTLFALVLVAFGLPVATRAQSSNTMVRFTYYHGAVTVGTMDVELFDQEKPVTVSNFLHYVRSGAYDNLMLHRCVPGFVIQGGAARLINPLSTADFGGYLDTPNFGTITNEFHVGPRYSNVVGTIAMARAVPSNPVVISNMTPEELVQATNSASTDWFINLADNSGTLDTNWGGFTVFGRVVGATNMLDFFNRTNAMLGILEMDWLWFPGFSLFANVPCSYPALYPFPRMPPYPPLPRYPKYNQLYCVRIAEFPATDVTRPRVTVTSPAAGAKLTNYTTTFTGTASDNVGIRSIWYSVAGRGFTNVEAGTQWSVTTEVAAGTNYFYVQSVDTAGLRSPMVTRQFFNSVREPLRLTNVGNGTFLGATNLQLFEIQRGIVSLNVRPDPGHLFAGWTGSFIYDPPAVRFSMFSNAHLTATFVTNPFPPLKATYAGLFYNTNFPNQPSGSITFTVADQGGVSGRLNVNGRIMPFSGKISPLGPASIPVSTIPLNGVRGFWYVVFNLDVTNRSDQIRGGYVWDASTFSSAMAAERVRPGNATNPSPYAGKYTLAIPQGTNITQPGGWSFGAATVNAAGNATFAGTLADGTPFTQAAPVIATNGYWPFYTGLYGGRGSIFGWVLMNFGQPTGDLSGAMRWRKTGPLPGRPYPNGFEFYPTLTGSRYTPATMTNRVLNFSDGILALKGPNLAAPITNQITLATNNTVMNLDPNPLTFLLAKPSGLFSGTIRPPGEARTLTYKGAVLQSQGYGVGHYVSTNRSGEVYFGP